MSTPTGTLSRISPTEVELAVSRVIAAEVDDVWASVTSSDRTAAWIGPWSGEARPGATIQLTMVLEEGDPVVDVRLDACDGMPLPSFDDYYPSMAPYYAGIAQGV